MKLLITGAWKYSETELKTLRNAGHDIEIHEDERASVPNASEIEAVICNGLFLYNDIREFTKLKYIQLTSAGFDRVPMEYVTGHNIEIHNARGVYSIPMAEFAVCSVLDFYKDSNGFIQKQQNKKWDKNRNLRELAGKTICVVGCGSVGTECAKRFKAFDTRVIGVDAYVTEWFDGIVELNTGLKEADVVILTLPLTDETRGLFNKEKLMSVRSDAVFVNISRGAVLTLDAIQSRRDIFFALDVFEEEPLAEGSPLWTMPNVKITPHNSFVGDGNISRLNKVVLGGLV